MIHVKCQNPATIPTKAATWGNRPRDGDREGRGQAAAEGLLPVDHHERGEERDRHRERDDGDLGGGVERWSREERLDHVHAMRIKPP